MSIEYTYEIIKVDEAARCMEIIYTANGHQTMHIGARLPFEGETLESVIRQYSPVAYWQEQKRPLAIPSVGSKGTLAPVAAVEPPKVEDSVFAAIFPTPPSGAIGSTIFK